MYMQIKCKHQAHGKLPNYPLVLQRLGWLAGRCSDCKWGWAVPKAGLLRRNRKRINTAVTCHFKRSWGAIEKSVPDAVRRAIITEQWAPLSFSRQHPQETLLCNQGKRCNQARIQPSFRNSPCRQHKGFSMVLCEVGDQRLGSATTSRVNALLSTSSVHLSSESPEGVLEEGWGFRPKYTCTHRVASTLSTSVSSLSAQQCQRKRKFLADWQHGPEWADTNNLIWLLQQLSLQNLHWGRFSWFFFPEIWMYLWWSNSTGTSFSWQQTDSTEADEVY